MREGQDGRDMRGLWRIRSGGTFLASLACLATLASVSACGYQFQVEGAGPTIGGTKAAASTEPPPRLVIRTLENRTFEPNLETRYTNYIRYEFENGSGAQVVPDSEAADLVLSGQILSVTLPTLSFNLTTTLESRTEVVVFVKVEETRTKKQIWAQTIKGMSEFFITPDLQFNRALQNRAMEQAGRFIAADLAARFLMHVESGGLRKEAKTPAAPSPTP
jgi:hypothetical protein